MILNDHSTNPLTLLQLHLGGDRNFHYLLADPASRRAAVVDPGFDPDRLHHVASERDLVIERILVTHGHGDHIGGVERLAELTGAVVHAGRGDVHPNVETLADGQTFELGELPITALHTPGHAPDHYVFRCEDALITGDLLFCGKVGGTGSYFPGSSAEEEWASLHRVLELPDTTRIFPGHDYYGGEGHRPWSTVGHERLHNPFLVCEDFAAFVHLKENWAAYKKEHEIR